MSTNCIISAKICFPFGTNTTRDGVQCWVRSLGRERQDTKVSLQAEAETLNAL